MDFVIDCTADVRVLKALVIVDHATQESVAINMEGHLLAWRGSRSE